MDNGKLVQLVLVNGMSSLKKTTTYFAFLLPVIVWMIGWNLIQICTRSTILHIPNITQALTLCLTNASKATNSDERPTGHCDHFVRSFGGMTKDQTQKQRIYTNNESPINNE